MSNKKKATPVPEFASKDLAAIDRFLAWGEAWKKLNKKQRTKSLKKRQIGSAMKRGGKVRRKTK